MALLLTLVLSGTACIGPKAVFIAIPTSGEAPLPVQFTDQSVQGTLPIAAWAWDFGDQQTSDQQSPAHTYDNPGIYSVSLEVSNRLGSNISIRQNYITVQEAGEGEGEGEGEPAVLSVGTAAGAIDDTVEIPVTLQTNGTQPAVALLMVEYNSNNVEFVGAEAGPAALAANKRADAYVSQDGLVRFLVWRFDTPPLGDGELLAATFRILSDNGSGVVPLIAQSASLADESGRRITVELVSGHIQIGG